MLVSFLPPRGRWRRDAATEGERDRGQPPSGASRHLPPRGRIIAAVLLGLATPAAAQDRQPPYWASIASGEAMMRAGPGRNYPGLWLYKRRDLPIRVVRTYPNWRMVEDPDGTRGWMLVSLLSDRRTAIVRPGNVKPIRVAPDEDSRARYLAQPGVVGRISQCGNGWCRIAVGDRRGFIRVDDIWGLDENEAID